MHETLLPREFSGGRLRRLRPADRVAFQAYRSIPELGRYQAWSPMSKAEALDLLFSATKVSCVLGITDERNLPSIRLLERLGFQYLENRRAVFRGEQCSEKVYALSRNPA